MTITTWIKEYYPINSELFAHDFDESDAVKQMIWMWTGLKQENRDKHQVALLKDKLIDRHPHPYDEINDFEFDVSNHALCYYWDKPGALTPCDRCRLVSCGRGSYYYFSIKYKDPNIMIKRLRTILESIEWGVYDSIGEMMRRLPDEI